MSIVKGRAVDQVSADARRGGTLHSATSALKATSPAILRVALAVVFVWFGALKVIGNSPVVEVIGAALPWFDVSWLVPSLGVVEVVLGGALLVGRWLPQVVAVMVGHLIGTFSVLVMAPHLAFQHGNPLLLTIQGEFVVKNFVLIAGGLALVAMMRSSTPPSSADVETRLRNTPGQSPQAILARDVDPGANTLAT
jgi:uncharacterized membrane protein YkgB